MKNHKLFWITFLIGGVVFLGVNYWGKVVELLCGMNKEDIIVLSMFYIFGTGLPITVGIIDLDNNEIPKKWWIYMPCFLALYPLFRI